MPSVSYPPAGTASSSGTRAGSQATSTHSFASDGVALVIGDHPARTFQAHELTADWTFVRFHYGHRGRDGNYSERELEEWAIRIEHWRGKADVYAYFNNDWKGYAVRNGLWLKKRLDT